MSNLAHKLPRLMCNLAHKLLTVDWEGERVRG
jgi:hypothetical protein